MIASPTAPAAALPPPTMTAPTDAPAAGPSDAHLFDMAMASRPGAIDGLAAPADLQAKLMANPASFGERVLSSLERLHADSVRVNRAVDQAAPGPAAAPARTELPGPAALNPAAAPAGAAEDRTGHLMGMVREVFSFAVETQLVAKSGTQFASTVNMLLKGQ